MKNFKDKVVIVTGASSGIGEAMAREFAAQGARVVLGARSVQKLQLIAGEIRSQGGQAAYCGVDVTNVDECRRLIETAVNEFGGIDVLVCNAGLSMRAIFDDVDLGVLHRLMDVNFWGTVNCCKFALPYLQRSRGSIVGISSVAGLHGLPGRTGYSASKYAMTGFLETLRIENLKKGLHVMIACPGFTASNVRFSALTADGSAQGETPQRGQDDDFRRGRPDRRPRRPEAQASLPDGERGARHPFRQEIRAGFPRQNVLSGDVQRTRFALEIAPDSGEKWSGNGPGGCMSGTAERKGVLFSGRLFCSFGVYFPSVVVPSVPELLRSVRSEIRMLYSYNPNNGSRTRIMLNTSGGVMTAERIASATRAWRR